MYPTLWYKKEIRQQTGILLSRNGTWNGVIFNEHNATYRYQ